MRTNNQFIIKFIKENAFVCTPTWVTDNILNAMIFNSRSEAESFANEHWNGEKIELVELDRSQIIHTLKRNS